jgi:hypothetical protein
MLNRNLSYCYDVYGGLVAPPGEGGRERHWLATNELLALLLAFEWA